MSPSILSPNSAPSPSDEQDVLANPIIAKKPALVAPEPEHCPGPDSEAAGKADGCASCPNQAICAAQTPRGPDPDVPLICARLAGVRRKILVLSGKGGVGKSTFTTLLAHALASATTTRTTTTAGGGGGGDGGDHEGEREGELMSVGVMDTDICGPSIPRMMGVEGESFHVSGGGWSPVMARDNLSIMSIQFMLSDKDSAVIWRGDKKSGLIKQFLRDVEWGDLDFLLVDTPPGTTDEHLSVNALLKESGIDGAVVVTTPQEVALLDVRKELDFCRKAGIKVLGLVENMSGFVCPKCRHENQIFRATTGGGRHLASVMNVPFLGEVPLDPRIGMAADYGESFFDAYPDSPAGKALRSVVHGIAAGLGMKLNLGQE